jgi:hypothetical protein
MNKEASSIGTAPHPGHSTRRHRHGHRRYLDSGGYEATGAYDRTKRRRAKQNERARVSLEVDLTHKLNERWDSQLYRNFRRRSLKYVKENYFVDDGILEVDHLDPDTATLFGFFEDIGYLTRNEMLQLERAWATYGGLMMAWPLWEPAIKKEREADNDASLYEDMEYLYRQMVELERRRGIRSERPTKEELRRFVEQELLAAEAGKEPTADSEYPTKG